MNPTQTKTKTSLSVNFFLGSSLGNDYVWENLIIERRIKVGWLYKLYKGSILESFWKLLSSPVI
ncbi:MAG: hypothetical protein HY424_00880 [Candidatus Levybacteria bacterium]|nr:hypothetical protein [Candidatus Levybacteria bacterium]